MEIADSDEPIVRVSDTRCEAIKQRVTDLLETCNLHELPLNAHAMIEILGIPLIPYSTLPPTIQDLLETKAEDAICCKKNGKWIIAYNDRKAAKNSRRMLFTLAHELGHVWLDHTELSDLAEKEANFFAKYLITNPILIEQLKCFSPEQIMHDLGCGYETATYGLNYFRKRQEYGPKTYLDYELRIYNQFKDFIAKRREANEKINVAFMHLGA